MSNYQKEKIVDCTPLKRRVMRRMYNDGFNYSDIARVFGIHHSTVMYHLKPSMKRSKAIKARNYYRQKRANSNRRLTEVGKFIRYRVVRTLEGWGYRHSQIARITSLNDWSVQNYRLNRNEKSYRWPNCGSFEFREALLI